MKKLKNIIIIIIILIIIIGITIVLIFMNKPKDSMEENLTTIESTPKQQEQEDGQVTDTTKFYTVNEAISTYLNTINRNNSSYYTVREDGQKVAVVDENQINQKVYNLLSEKYIKENNIEKNNIFDYVDKIETKVLFVPLKMNYIKNENLETYSVYGIVEDLYCNYVKEEYLIVNVDYENKIFSVEPQIANQLKNINDIELKKSNIQIDSNSDNKIKDVNIEDEYICQEYINTYKRLALARPDLAYSYLDEEYRNKRFGNLDEFKKYVETNKNEIKGLTLKKYLIDDNNYVCKDKYDNTYTFIQNSIMDFKYKIDDYTIDTQTYLDSYNSQSDQGKASYDAQKIIKMINSRDYSTIYKHLDESFKDTQQITQDNLILYMQNKYSKHYTYNDNTITKQGDIYIIKLNLTDATGQENFTQEMTLMIKLKDNADFTMAFSV